MKNLVFPSVLDVQTAEVEGEKTGEVACTSPAFFFGGWHSILTSFILAKRHTAGDHTY